MACHPQTAREKRKKDGEIEFQETKKMRTKRDTWKGVTCLIVSDKTKRFLFW
jgi:hypothetical protein